ncbi:patched domain-containing protein 3-like [Dreissena polymorpha]|nr:patched domain-containing protein 3-like [Dreissena polymorpha]
MEGFSTIELDVAFANHLSLDEELDKNINGDIALFSITFTLMLTYACVATMNMRDAVNQRALLGGAGILAAGLAIIASFGVCMAIGLEFVSIVGVMPFLIIGIGIDDMFVLLSGLSGAQGEATVDDRMKETLRNAGVGVTITSLTNLIAFMSGAGSNFLAVRNFCIYTGVAVIICYINNITFFAACLTIHERRVETNRHFFLMCKTVPSTDEAKNSGQSKAGILCCAGSRPRNRKEAESLLDKLPSWLMPKIVLKTPFKIGIVLLFAGYMAASIYGCVHLKQGLLFSQLVSEKSYYHKYSKLLEDKFSRQRVVAIVTTHPYAYSDASTERDLNAALTKAKLNSYFDPKFEINWLSTYISSAYYKNSSEVNFISGLKTFLQAVQYSRFENDVVIDSDGTSIKASRVYLMSRDLKDSQEEGLFMVESRKIADDAELKCFAYSPFFISFEQYIQILPQTLLSTGIALAVVFVVTCIFMPHPVLIIFVTIAVTMIMVGVFGFLLYLDVALSSITMIHLIMSIGFSVDFTAHICHGFMTSRGETRDEKVRAAIDKTGAPIFHGAVSSVLGIIVLVAAKSYIFRTFAAVMGFVLFFGIAHALLLLPVVLSWIGPMSSEDKKPLQLNGTHKRESPMEDLKAYDGPEIASPEKIKRNSSPPKTRVGPSSDDNADFEKNKQTYKLQLNPGSTKWKKVDHIKS